MSCFSGYLNQLLTLCTGELLRLDVCTFFCLACGDDFRNWSNNEHVFNGFSCMCFRLRINEIFASILSTFSPEAPYN